MTVSSSAEIDKSPKVKEPLVVSPTRGWLNGHGWPGDPPRGVLRAVLPQIAAESTPGVGILTAIGEWRRGGGPPAKRYVKLVIMSAMLIWPSSLTSHASRQGKSFTAGSNRRAPRNRGSAMSTVPLELQSPRRNCGSNKVIDPARGFQSEMLRR